MLSGNTWMQFADSPWSLKHTWGALRDCPQDSYEDKENGGITRVIFPYLIIPWCNGVGQDGGGYTRCCFTFLVTSGVAVVPWWAFRLRTFLISRHSGEKIHLFQAKWVKNCSYFSSSQQTRLHIFGHAQINQDVNWPPLLVWFMLYSIYGIFDLLGTQF